MRWQSQGQHIWGLLIMSQVAPPRYFYVPYIKNANIFKTTFTCWSKLWNLIMIWVSFTFYFLNKYICVYVCERERERENANQVVGINNLIVKWVLLCCGRPRESWWRQTKTRFGYSYQESKKSNMWSQKNPFHFIAAVANSLWTGLKNRKTLSSIFKSIKEISTLSWIVALPQWKGDFA